MTTALRLFLSEQPWFVLLSDQEKAQVLADAYERRTAAGEAVCRAGEPAGQWIGVMGGLVKASVMTQDGKTTTYAGIAPGGWLGEGSVLNGTSRRFDVIALRDSHIALVPRSTFMRLYENNLPFCHYLIEKLNNRLAQQMALIEIDRLIAPEIRVARFLLMLAESQRSRSPAQTLEITQSEIAQLCGLSRQFTNKVVSKLVSLGLVEHQYGRLTLLDKERLYHFDPNAGS
jgi:CRP/FNR family cyclic AMP-dependent transcriptional regulator